MVGTYSTQAAEFYLYTAHLITTKHLNNRIDPSTLLHLIILYWPKGQAYSLCWSRKITSTHVSLNCNNAYTFKLNSIQVIIQYFSVLDHGRTRTRDLRKYRVSLHTIPESYLYLSDSLRRY